MSPAATADTRAELTLGLLLDVMRQEEVYLAEAGPSLMYVMVADEYHAIQSVPDADGNFTITVAVVELLKRGKRRTPKGSEGLLGKHIEPSQPAEVTR